MGRNMGIGITRASLWPQDRRESGRAAATELVRVGLKVTAERARRQLNRRALARRRLGRRAGVPFPNAGRGRLNAA